MECWKSEIRLNEPNWIDYRDLIESLGAETFPKPVQLNRLLPEGLKSGRGKQIGFVSAETIPGVEYEKHIFEQGQVSTRNGSWHDLFNALVWARFPAIKAAMNAAHYRQCLENAGTDRGPVRDALTLLDESGGIVFSTDEAKLKALAGQEWRDVFGSGFAGLRIDSTSGDWFPDDLNISLCGHALLEKFLSPYKSITAKVLLVCIDSSRMHWTRNQVLHWLDRAVARYIDENKTPLNSRQLAPLPLMGIPGWSGNQIQDPSFYADTDVFRSRRGFAVTAPILHLDPGQDSPVSDSR